MQKWKLGDIFKKSVFRYFIGFNLIILLVPITASLLGYQYNVELVSDMVIENSNLLLQQSQKVIDERITQIQNVAITISKDTNVLEYGMYPDPLSRDSVYSNYMIQKILVEVPLLSDFVDLLFVQYNEKDSVISGGDTHYSLRKFYEINKAFL